MKIYKLILVIILLISFVLRFYKIGDNPPGLYIDEVAIGVNADKILTTGRDEHSEPFPLFFKSFGDYKMPVYIYSVTGAMSVFGKNEFAIRFPSAFFGSLTVIVLYLFIKKLMEIEKNFSSSFREKTALLSALLLGISSWHIHFSRGGFEANQALFIFLLATLFAIFYLDKKKIPYLFGSTILFALSIYTYHSYRIVSPLFFGVLLAFIYYINPKDRKSLVLSFIFFILLCLPVLIFSFSDQGSARFSATSVFSELGNLTLIQKITLYPLALLKNYLSYFSFYFLFDTGDGIGRHQIPEFGPMFKWQLPFMLVGIYSIIKTKSKLLKPAIILLLFIAPLPASFAVPSPHTLRVLLMVIPLTILVSLGILFLFKKINKFKIITYPVLIAIILFEFIFYSHYYYVHYPQVNSLDWGAGYKEVVLKTDELRGEFDEIIIDKNLDFAPIYFNFYSDKNSPKLVDVTWNKPKNWEEKRVLYIRPYYGPQSSQNIIYKVYLPGRGEKTFAQFWNL